MISVSKCVMTLLTYLDKGKIRLAYYSARQYNKRVQVDQREQIIMQSKRKGKSLKRDYILTQNLTNNWVMAVLAEVIDKKSYKKLYL